MMLRIFGLSGVVIRCDREDTWRRFGLGNQELYNGDSKLDVLVSVQAELSATV